MYIEPVPKRNSPPAVLLRESFRDHGRIRKRSLANLTHWSSHVVEHFRGLLRGGVAVSSAAEVMTIERSVPQAGVAVRRDRLDRSFQPRLSGGAVGAVCRNPLLAEQRARKREELLGATERERQMRQKLKARLFDNEEIEDVRQAKSSPVQPAERSDSAKQKDATGVNQDAKPIHSFRSLLADLPRSATTSHRPRSTPTQKSSWLPAPLHCNKRLSNFLASNPNVPSNAPSIA